ncbi:MAG: flagellar basal body P-ring protein FlgI [Rhodothermales bacterium]|nr:flagellar basal body P-ring protein FlgI [Rhodothermales bacterium]
MLGLLLPVLAHAQGGPDTRLKDLVVVEGAMPVQLTGYGLVVGLDRTGDRARGHRGAPYTVNSIVNMLRQFGLTVDPALLGARNVAAVMVTATLDPFHGSGARLDVTVSSLGDARSLSGGVLLQTPLMNPLTGQVHGMAQGAVSTGAVLAASAGTSVRVNHSNTGRIPNGALVTAAPPVQLDAARLGLVLRQPDFTNAARIAEIVNATYADAATVEHAGLVRVAVPSGEAPSALLATLEALTVAVDVPARVVINERTGTIVAGGDVRIAEVMVTYGSLIVSTQADPFVSQPAPLSQGQTVAGAAGSAQIEEEGARSVVLSPNTDVSQLAAALNELGLTARDVIAIFQAIKRAGALQGELVIL